MRRTVVTLSVIIPSKRFSITVRSISRHLRSLLIALAVFALSATVAFAARPTSTPPTHAGAQGPAATETADGDEDGAPDADETDDPDVDEAPETDAPETDAPETEAPETDAPETDAPDATDRAAAEHPDNHGKLVSAAAQTETPEGYDNHGAWVRSVAQVNHGHSAEKAAAKQARKANH